MARRCARCRACAENRDGLLRVPAALIFRYPAAPGARGGRQLDAKGRALADHAVDAQLAAVALHHMLDDGQAQSGAAGLARTAAIDAVEAFGQARHMLGIDAGAGVGDPEFGAALLEQAPAGLILPPPGYSAPLFSRLDMALEQLGAGAGERQVRTGLGLDVVAAIGEQVGQGARVLGHLFEQIAGTHPFEQSGDGVPSSRDSSSKSLTSVFMRSDC